MRITRCLWGGALSIVAVAAAIGLHSGCGADASDSGVVNPFSDLDPIELTGKPQVLATAIAPLGTFDEGEVLRLRVDSAVAGSVLVLLQDGDAAEAGIIAGGGPANQAFQYRVQLPGRYFVFVQAEGATGEVLRGATVTAERGDPDYEPQGRQVVLVEFEHGYLHDPGLFDPVSGTDEEQALLRDLEPEVRVAVVAKLRELFDGTPIEITDQPESSSETVFSRLTFVADRVLAGDQGGIDAALPAPDPSRPECQQRVVFGEVLPGGSRSDPGNSVPDDQAVVYVGSFQGRGQECRTAAVNSLNNMVLILAQTAAHEVGHLVGLQHVAQIDVMNRSATLAFQRELHLDRGQVEIDVGSATRVLTTVIQDPDLYFRSAFMQPSTGGEPE